MNGRRRFVAFVLLGCCFAAVSARADDQPRAYVEGLKCARTPPDSQTPGIVVCQIVDDPDPLGGSIERPEEPSPWSSQFDSVLQLLTALENALQLSITAPGPEAPHTP